MEKIQVVLASPSDLFEERQMIKELVNSLNPLYMKKEICIDLRMWEDSTAGMNVDGPQGRIDLDLEIPKADLFICMYGEKIGTKLPNEDVAGTEHELNIALESYFKYGKPDVKAFFKVFEKEELTDDIKKIEKIAKKLQPYGLYTSFKGMDNLKDNVNKILQAEVMELIGKQGQVIPEIHKYIEVSDTSELIDNFVSNNKLVLNNGYYDMLGFEKEKADSIFKEDVFDGKQLVISKVSNVTVVGDNSTLLVNPRYANVICFRNCNSIKLIGLTLGHVPRKGSCLGSVLRFDNCKNIQLESLELFGCGTYGIELYGCSNIKSNGIEIYECSYGALKVENTDFEFSNSVIYDCNKTAWSIIDAAGSQLSFNNVSIYDNHIDYDLFSLKDSTIFCRGACVYNNSFASLSDQKILNGLFEGGNIIQRRDKFCVTISSMKSIEREEYESIRGYLCTYGTIEEAVFDDGDVHIVFSTYKMENINMIEKHFKSYDSLMIERNNRNLSGLFMG